MPTEFIPASIPAERDALRRRLEYAIQRLVPSVPTLDTIAWVSFFWGATNGLLIGLNDLQELRELLPPLGYDPTDEFGRYPLSPENQALFDRSKEGAAIWATPAKRAERDIIDGQHFFAGRMPEDTAVAWYGYLRGRFEAGSINESEYAHLLGMLPIVEQNPVDLIVESADAAKRENRL